jgi:hypothetical protein
MAKKAVKKARKKAAKGTFKIPTAAQAKKKYPQVAAAHTREDRQRWVMVKQRGNWSYEKTGAATASAPQTICHYDPNTGTWTDCYNVT